MDTDITSSAFRWSWGQKCSAVGTFRLLGISCCLLWPYPSDSSGKVIWYAVYFLGWCSWYMEPKPWSFIPWRSLFGRYLISSGCIQLAAKWCSVRGFWGLYAICNMEWTWCLAQCRSSVISGFKDREQGSQKCVELRIGALLVQLHMCCHCGEQVDVKVTHGQSFRRSQDNYPRQMWQSRQVWTCKDPISTWT